MPFSPSLTPEQLRSLVDTNRRARKIRRATGVARFGGWTGGLFAGLTLIGAAFSFSLPAMYVGLGLATVAYGEFHGASLLSRLDPRGPRRLAMNQALLAFVLCSYALWCLYQGPPKELDSELAAAPDIAQMADGLEKMAYALLYGTLLVVGVVAPGLTALYYLSRARLIRELRASADASVIEAVKAA